MSTLFSSSLPVNWVIHCNYRRLTPRLRDSINVLPRYSDHVIRSMYFQEIQITWLQLSHVSVWFCLAQFAAPESQKTALLILASTVSVETHLFSGPSYLWLPTSWGPSNRSFDCYDGGKTDINQLIARLFLLHSRHNSSLLVLDSAYGLGLSKENIVVLICEIKHIWLKCDFIFHWLI